MIELSKTFILGLGIFIFGVLSYFIFSDILGVPATVVAILTTPFQFSIKYLFNKNWIFKKDDVQKNKIYP